MSVARVSSLLFMWFFFFFFFLYGSVLFPVCFYILKNSPKLIIAIFFLIWLHAAVVQRKRKIPKKRPAPKAALTDTSTVPPLKKQRREPDSSNGPVVTKARVNAGPSEPPGKVIAAKPAKRQKDGIKTPGSAPAPGRAGRGPSRRRSGSKAGAVGAGGAVFI